MARRSVTQQARNQAQQRVAPQPQQQQPPQQRPAAMAQQAAPNRMMGGYPGWGQQPAPAPPANNGQQQMGKQQGIISTQQGIWQNNAQGMQQAQQAGAIRPGIQSQIQQHMDRGYGPQGQGYQNAVNNPPPAPQRPVGSPWANRGMPTQPTNPVGGRTGLPPQQGAPIRGINPVNGRPVQDGGAFYPGPGDNGMPPQGGPQGGGFGQGAPFPGFQGQPGGQRPNTGPPAHAGPLDGPGGVGTDVGYSPGAGRGAGRPNSGPGRGGDVRSERLLQELPPGLAGRVSPEQLNRVLADIVGGSGNGRANERARFNRDYAQREFGSGWSGAGGGARAAGGGARKSAGISRKSGSRRRSQRDDESGSY